MPVADDVGLLDVDPPEVGLLPDEPSQLESETIDKLRALGYVE